MPNPDKAASFPAICRRGDQSLIPEAFLLSCLAAQSFRAWWDLERFQASPVEKNRVLRHLEFRPCFRSASLSCDGAKIFETNIAARYGRAQALASTPDRKPGVAIKCDLLGFARLKTLAFTSPSLQPCYCAPLLARGFPASPWRPS